MKKQIVFLTIGEAPRLDLKETYDTYFEGMKEVSQIGLLDNLSHEAAETLLGKRATTHNILTSRFIDGYQIVMDHALVEAALQKRIDELESQGVTAVILMCTGSFDHLKSTDAVLIEAEKVTIPYVKEHYLSSKIGVLVPLETQVNDSHDKWQLGERVLIDYASPYNFDAKEFEKAANNFIQAGVSVIILDCIGYNMMMQRFMQEKVPGIDVILSNELLFDYVVKKFID